MPKNRKETGFSLVELVIVVVIVMVIAAFAIPTLTTTLRNIRISGDGLDINGEILLAKMRAAANFTQSRVYFDFTARTFRTETWDKATSAWVSEKVGAPQNLAQGVTYDFGGVTNPPPRTQAAIGQAPACTNDTGLSPQAGAAIADTACIVFNSRGFPVASTGAPTAQDAIYITDGTSVFAVTLSATGLTHVWRTDTVDTAGTSWNKR